MQTDLSTPASRADIGSVTTDADCAEVPQTEEEVWAAYRRACRWCVKMAGYSLLAIVYALAQNAPDVALAAAVFEGLALPWVWYRLRRGRDISLAEARQRV